MLKMFGQRIATKVFGEVTPDGMDVVRIVLGIVILNHEAITLDAVVVLLSPLSRTHPNES
jgi:hypothetical protein